MGLASGSLPAPALAQALATPALLTNALAAAVRGATLLRNARLTRKTTLQTAIGVRHPRIVQILQGMLSGSLGTREFVHGESGDTGASRGCWRCLPASCCPPRGWPWLPPVQPAACCWRCACCT